MVNLQTEKEKEIIQKAKEERSGVLENKYFKDDIIKVFANGYFYRNISYFIFFIGFIFIFIRRFLLACTLLVIGIILFSCMVVLKRKETIINNNKDLDLDDVIIAKYYNSEYFTKGEYMQAFNNYPYNEELRRIGVELKYIGTEGSYSSMFF